MYKDGVIINGITIKPDNTGYIPENITEKVVELGVDAEYVKSLHTRIMHKTPDFYTFNNEPVEEQLVPTSKIIGIFVNEAPETDVITTIRTGISSKEGFYHCFTYLNNRTIDDLAKDYETGSWIDKADKIKLGYYTELDGYIVENARHRCLTAILFNLPYVKAKVYKYHYDIEEAKWQKALDEVNSKYPDLRIYRLFTGECDVTFTFKDKNIYLMKYEECFDEVDNRYARLTNLENKLDSDIKNIVKLLKYPVFIRNILLMFPKYKCYNHAITEDEPIISSLHGREYELKEIKEV